MKVVQGDVTDLVRMKDLIETLKKQHGSINGVIHAAGILDDDHIRLISRTTQDGAEHVLKPKVGGTLVLYQLLRDEPLDFVVLFSNLSSMLGGVRLGAYAAANSFLDSFSYYAAERTSTIWKSINWDTWEFGNENSKEESHISPDQGVDILNEVLSMSPNHVVVSSIPLSTRYEKLKESFKSLSSSMKVRIFSRLLANSQNIVGQRSESKADKE